MPAGTAGGLRPATLAYLGRSASHSSELSWKRSAASLGWCILLDVYGY